MNEVMTAADIMESIMNEGIYPEIKNLKYRDKTIKSTIKKRLLDSEVKRHEYKKYGIVAKFVPKRISDIDYEGLNEYLSNIGLLVPTIKLEHKRIKENLFLYEQVKDFQLDSEYYVKPSFNKLGNNLNKPNEYEVEHWKINDLMSAYHPLQSEIHRYENMYEEAKIKMFHCADLQRQKKLKHKYGSVSLIEKKPEYDIQGIYEEFGVDFLIEYGRPDNQLLDNFILKGMITQGDIDQFKEVKDIRLDFVVMTLEDENKMIEMLNRRTLIASENRRRA